MSSLLCSLERMSDPRSELPDAGTTAYYRSLERNAADKYMQVRENVRAGTVVDLGCGSGAWTRLVLQSRKLVNSVVGVDVSEHAVAAASANSPAHSHARLAFIRADVRLSLFRPQSVTTFHASAVAHEVFADDLRAANGHLRFAEDEHSLYACLKHRRRELAPDGVLIVRDVLRPARRPVVLVVRERRPRPYSGCSAGTVFPATTHDHEAPLERFRLFLTSQLWLDGTVPEWSVVESSPDVLIVETDLATAWEYALKKDYRHKEERNELYCYASLRNWQALAARASFCVDRVRHFHSRWVMENRILREIELYDPRTRRRLAYPPTCSVLALTPR
jgi:SAM-dependent methyltransferase